MNSDELNAELENVKLLDELAKAKKSKDKAKLAKAKAALAGHRQKRRLMLNSPQRGEAQPAPVSTKMKGG